MKLITLALCVTVLATCHANIINTNADDSKRILPLRRNRAMFVMCNSSTPIKGDAGISWTKSKGGSVPMPLKAVGRVKITDFPGGSNITIEKADLNDVGNYTCRFAGSIDGHPNAEATIQIATNASTSISGKSKNIKEGNDLVIPCKVAGTPRPLVKWTRNGVDALEALNQTSRLTFANSDDGFPNGILTLKKLVRNEDAGDYCCIAENVVGRHQTCIIVRVKDKYAALWPFIGIVAEVVLLTAIIYIYEKKKGKSPDMDDSDTDHANERSSQSKGDVRQRK